MFSILARIQNYPITRVQETLTPLFKQMHSDTHSKQGEEPKQKLQHKIVSLADYHISPEPKHFKRCNDIIRSLLLNDDLGSVPKIFQALDETFFNGRVGQLASAIGVVSKTPYIAGVGGYSFRDAKGLVIHLPTWEGKTSTLRDDLNILFREMAFLDFYVINTCRCEDCQGSNSVNVCEFVEYLTRLDKLANLNLERFQKQWNIGEDNDFDMAKESVEKVNQARKMEPATQRLGDPVAVEYSYARGVEKPEDASQTLVEALFALVADLEDRGDYFEDRGDYFEELYMGLLECTKTAELPQECMKTAELT